jgi:glycosyltransferase involved in cell wall biosynthesis
VLTASPKVSIITPSFNQGIFIEETILSVLNQTYKNIEYIIIDGGSTDNTMKIVDRYKDRIDIIVHERDKGQSDALNKGLKLATGELVGWINSDDILYPDCVEEIVNLAANNEDGVIFYSSKLDFIDNKGKMFRQIERQIFSRSFLLNKNYDVVQPGSFYKLSAVKEAGFMNDTVRYCIDLELWLKLLQNGKIYYCSQKPLAAFRLWELSKTVNEEIDFLQDIHKVLRSNGMRLFSPNTKKLIWSKTLKRIKYSFFR